MRNLLSITKKELKSFFYSPIAYIVVTVFLAILGFFFYYSLTTYGMPSMRPIFGIITLLLIIVTPMITMRLVSEEKKSGTIETLMTAPVKDWQVVIGKYLAAIVFFAFLILPSLLYVVILERYGTVDYGVVFTNYLGIFLLGFFFIAFGLMVSSATKNQIVAAVVSFVVLFMLWLVGVIVEVPSSELLTGGVGRQLHYYAFAGLKYTGTIDHILAFSKGVIDTRDLVYFVSFIVFFLFLSVRVFENRKWR